MDELQGVWSQWLRPSAGILTVQWSLLLAVASIAGYLCQRYLDVPKILGYTLVGAFAGWMGFGGALWPLHGAVLFLLELGVAVALFECGGRITLRWFRHNPMILVQSLVEAGLTYVFVAYGLQRMGIPAAIAGPLGLIAMAASPIVLGRVVADTRAAGAVSDRAMALATLSTLYALMLGSIQVEILAHSSASWSQNLMVTLGVLGVSVVVAAMLCFVMRLSLRFMSPASENTSLLMLALIAAAAAVAAHMGGSAPLAALLGGMLLKQLQPRPWVWPRQLGTASSLLGMLLFVLVSTVAAQAAWSGGVVLAVAALVLARFLAKAVGVGLCNIGSGSSGQQAVWTVCAMMPMSAVALLMTSQFVQALSPSPVGQTIADIALPAILLLELLGAVLATLALRRAGEARPAMIRSTF